MIVIAGTIGAGKTSLATLLAKHLNSKAFYESVDNNPVLPYFYKDPQKYAFLLQIYFLNKRLAQLKAADKIQNSVIDRSIFEDSLLFHLNADLGRATDTEVSVYDSLLENMLQELPQQSYHKKPGLLIHINISFDTMLKRIAKRNRPYEQIAQDPSLYHYYQELNHRYSKWYQDYDESPKLQINGDQLDFVNDDLAHKRVLNIIDQKISQLHQITNIASGNQRR